MSDAARRLIERAGAIDLAALSRAERAALREDEAIARVTSTELGCLTARLTAGAPELDAITRALFGRDL